MSTERRATVATALLAALASCGGEQHGASNPMQPLPESRALAVILGAFQDAGAAPETHRTIQIAGSHTMEIDVATAGHPHGVEFVTEQDRVDFGSVLPHRQTPGSLLTIAGTGPDARTDVLLLDDREFMYQSEASQAGPDAPTLVEVEDRLHRAVIDYLTYVRQHGEI